MTNPNIAWLLDSDPALKWQVERDLLGAPETVWSSTRELTNTSGFGARLLALQDPDGQWAGGAYFPGRTEPRALTREGDSRRRDPASGVPPRLSAMLSFIREEERLLDLIISARDFFLSW